LERGELPPSKSGKQTRLPDPQHSDAPTAVSPSDLHRRFEFLSYQLSIVVKRATLAVTGNGEYGFESGEGA